MHRLGCKFASPAVLGSAGGRGMAGGMSNNATPQRLGRARNRGVADGVNGHVHPQGWVRFGAESVVE